MIVSRHVPRHRGLATVELAVTLPLLITVLVGLWEVGRLVIVKQIVSSAAREGGRQASTGRLTNAQVQQVVTRYFQGAGLPTQNLTVTVSDLTQPGVDVSAAAQLDQLQVTVSIPFSDVRLINLNLVTDSSTRITSQSTWFSIKDTPYPDPADPPIE